MNDRIVPGLPAFLSLVAPEEWVRYEIELAETPDSINKAGVGRAHIGAQRRKAALQLTIERMLMASQMPRNNVRAIAGAIMRFPRLGRRDSGNFAAPIEKCLGDALVNGRWIPDDDAGSFYFAGVEFEDVRGPNRTRIVMFIQDGG